MSDQVLNSFHEAKIAAMTALQKTQNQMEYLFEAMSKVQNNLSYYQSLVADIDFKIAAHQTSVEQLNLAEDNDLNLLYLEPSVAATSNAFNNTQSGFSEWSAKDMILHILRGAPEGYDVHTILNLMSSVFGVQVPRTTVSPQLSRMKHDRVVQLRGDTWSLTNQYRNLLAHQGR